MITLMISEAVCFCEGTGLTVCLMCRARRMSWCQESFVPSELKESWSRIGQETLVSFCIHCSTVESWERRRPRSQTSHNHVGYHLKSREDFGL